MALFKLVLFLPCLKCLNRFELFLDDETNRCFLLCYLTIMSVILSVIMSVYLESEINISFLFLWFSFYKHPGFAFSFLHPFY